VLFVVESRRTFPERYVGKKKKFWVQEKYAPHRPREKKGNTEAKKSTGTTGRGSRKKKYQKERRKKLVKNMKRENRWRFAQS